MTLTTGLLVLPGYPAPRLAEIARLAERSGYDYFWLADERFFREVYASLTHVAHVTERIQLGPCVTDPYSRHPALTAMAIATLDDISGGRAVLGIGAGVSGFRELGIAREKPAVAIRESVELIRRLLRGETVTYKGEHVSFDDGKLDFTPMRGDVPIYVASQQLHGCRVAGRVADGARAAGRDPKIVDLAARLNVCVHDDPEIARDVMRPGIVRTLVAQRPEFFTFKTAGVTVPPALAAKVMALPYTHDAAPLVAIAPEVPDDLVDAVCLTGPPDRVAREVIRLARGGITQLTVYPIAPEGRTDVVVERFQSEVMPRVRAAGE